MTHLKSALCLNPIVTFKVLRARRAYLKAKGRHDIAATKERLLEIVDDRYILYKHDGKNRKADALLDLATIKGNPTLEQKKRLERIRKAIEHAPILHETVAKQ